MAQLRPTLWRTCRVLANRRRLALLQLLISHEELSVSAIARELRLSVNTASEYLRALNARGLLSVRRAGSFVYYRIGSDDLVPDSAELLPAVVAALRLPGKSVERVFRAVTACTYPRRLKILRALSRKHLAFRELKAATRMSRAALQRHLKKLKDRRWVEAAAGRYRCRKPHDVLTQTLMRLAAR